MDKAFLAVILGKRDKQTGGIIPAALNGAGNTAREARARESVKARRESEKRQAALRAQAPARREPEKRQAALRAQAPARKGGKA